MICPIPVSTFLLIFSLKIDCFFFKVTCVFLLYGGTYGGSCQNHRFFNLEIRRYLPYYLSDNKLKGKLDGVFLDLRPSVLLPI